MNNVRVAVAVETRPGERIYVDGYGSSAKEYTDGKDEGQSGYP
jgi:hypothetical protein